MDYSTANERETRSVSTRANGSAVSTVSSESCGFVSGRRAQR